jgi:hypothetical protein
MKFKGGRIARAGANAKKVIIIPYVLCPIDIELGHKVNTQGGCPGANDQLRACQGAIWPVGVSRGELATLQWRKGECE